MATKVAFQNPADSIAVKHACRWRETAGNIHRFMVVAVCAALVGCSASVPECSSSEATGLVKEIAKEEVDNTFGARFANARYQVDAIRTQSIDDSTGQRECAAILFIDNEEIDITYTVEKTDDGKHFYVTVFGL